MINIILSSFIFIVIVIVLIIISPIILLVYVYNIVKSIISFIEIWRLYKKDVPLFLLKYRRLSMLWLFYCTKWLLVKYYFNNLLCNMNIIEASKYYYLCNRLNETYYKLYNVNLKFDRDIVIHEFTVQNLIKLIDNNHRVYKIDTSDIDIIKLTPFAWFKSRDFISRFNTLNLFIKYFKNKHKIPYGDL